MFECELRELGAEATLAEATNVQALARRAETRLLEVAAHWADLHGHLDRAGQATDASGPLPGLEKLVQLGGEGTPEVAEFAPAEFGAELLMSPYAGARLIGDALDLRHRLPRLWARIEAGEVAPWIGRCAAQATRHLSASTVAEVDRKISPWAHSVGWGRLQSLIDAAVLVADPTAAAQGAACAEQEQGVWVGQSNDHGIKEIHIRTEAPHAIWFDATIDRISDGLQLLGDADNKDIRRARAVGVIAQPQQALDLFAQAADASQTPESPSRSDLNDDSDEERCRPALSEPAEGLPTPADGRQRSSDVRPPATLYVHLTDEAIRGTDSTAIARLEGVGAISIDQVRRFLRHCHVTVKPVLDLPGLTPVDSYEIPDRLRDAVHLRSPADVFPFASNTSRRRQLDHTVPYRSPDSGGPPGQTRLDNLAPLTTFHHRIKTCGGWRVSQPFNGVFVWRSPHGRHFLVDHTGTHRPARTA